MRSINEDKGGQMIIINLLFLFMVIAVTVALIPAIKSILEISKQSDGLNCVGFTHATNPALSYNASFTTDTTSCLAIALYLPYIILVVLIGGVSKLLYDRSAGGGQQVGGF